MKKHTQRIPRASVFWPAAPSVLVALSLLATTPSHASPLFGVGDCAGCMTWQDAIAAGRIQQATDLTGPEQQFYGGQTPDFAYTPNMELFVEDVTDGLGLTHEALVMSWQSAPVPDTDNDDQNDLTVAAWEYVYDVDPDLTGTVIDLSILFPVGIWDFSIELEDAAGRVRGWFVDPSMVGLAFNTWHSITLDPSMLAPQGFIPGPIQDPLFDLTTVVKIRLDEAGMNTVTFSPAPPPGATIIGQWNAWNHLRVRAVPEPATLLLAGFGLLAAGRLRRSRTR